jgi:hypothetical protein
MTGKRSTAKAAMIRSAIELAWDVWRAAAGVDDDRRRSLPRAGERRREHRRAVAAGVKRSAASGTCLLYLVMTSVVGAMA